MHVIACEPWSLPSRTSGLRLCPIHSTLYRRVLCDNSSVQVQAARPTTEGGTSMKRIAMLLAAVIVIGAAIALGRYSEADDAPGGVVIAAVMIIGAVALGVKGVLHKG